MSNPVVRSLHLIFALQGHSFGGLRLKQIADAVAVSSPTTLRDLQLLAARMLGGIVHRLDQRVDDLKQRYSRSPK